MLKPLHENLTGELFMDEISLITLEPLLNLDIAKRCVTTGYNSTTYEVFLPSKMNQILSKPLEF